MVPFPEKERRNRATECFALETRYANQLERQEMSPKRITEILTMTERAKDSMLFAGDRILNNSPESTNELKQCSKLRH